jgi:hypothetical protein
MIKKFVTSAMMTMLVAVMLPFATATNAEAYAGCPRHHRAAHRRTRTTTTNSYRYASAYYKKPNVYQRHRRLFNTAIGAGAGALVGGLLGGRRGAGIGILGGALGSQVFTHYQHPQNHYRVRRP